VKKEAGFLEYIDGILKNLRVLGKIITFFCDLAER